MAQWPDTPIPNDEWVTMPQYGGMQYMYSPPSAHNDHDEGRLKLRRGHVKRAKRIPEDILEEDRLAEVVWEYCRQFNEYYEYWATQRGSVSYGE